MRSHTTKKNAGKMWKKAKKKTKELWESLALNGLYMP